MKLINKMLVSNLMMNKKRTMATIISITLSCILLFTVTIFFSTSDHEQVLSAMASYGTHHVIYRDLDYTKTDEYFKKTDTIAHIDFTQTIDEIYMSSINDAKETTKIKVESYDEDFESFLKLSTGSFPKNDREIAISSYLSWKSSYKVGDTIGKYTITGIYDDNFYQKSETFKMPTKDEFRPVVYTKKTFDTKNVHTTFVVTYKNIRDSYEEMHHTIKDLNLEYNSMFSIDSEHVEVNRAFLNSNYVHDLGEEPFKLYSYLLIILFVLSLFCIIIIYNSFSITLVERKKQYGILRSLGASKRQVISLVFKEVFILGILSIPLSLLVSYGITGLCFSIINYKAGTSMTPYLSLFYLSITMFFILFTIIISATTPAVKAGEITPIEAIRSSKDFKIKKSKERYPVIRKLFGVEGEVAYKNMRRNGKKFTATILSLSISIVIFIIASMFINVAVIDVMSSYKDDYDISLYVSSLDEKEKQAFIEKLKSLKYKDDLVYYKQTMAKFYKNSSMTPEFEEQERRYDVVYVTLFGLDDDSLREYKRNIGLKKDTPIIYNVISDISSNGTKTNYKAFKEPPTLEFTWDDIDKTLLKMDGFHLTEENYKNTFYSNSLVLTIDEFDKFYDEYMGELKKLNLCESFENDSLTIKINSKKFKKLDKEITKLLDEFATLQVQYTNHALENYEYYQDCLMIATAIYAFLGFIALISLTGMINSLSTNIEMRKTEFSMLRSIGLSKKGVNKMLQLESFFVILKTVLISMPVSFIIMFGIRAISKIKINPNESPTPMPIPWFHIVFAVFACLIIVLVATRFSAKKIKNQNIIDAIRDDSI